MLNRLLTFSIKPGVDEGRYDVKITDETQHIVTELNNSTAQEAAIIAMFKGFGETFYTNVVEPYKENQ